MKELKQAYSSIRRRYTPTGVFLSAAGTVVLMALASAARAAANSDQSPELLDHQSFRLVLFAVSIGHRSTLSIFYTYAYGPHPLRKPRL